MKSSGKAGIVSIATMRDHRQLKDLSGVGPAMLSDLRILGIHSVNELALQDGKELYDRLSNSPETCRTSVSLMFFAVPSLKRVIRNFPSSRETGGTGARSASVRNSPFTLHCHQDSNRAFCL